jgi:ribonuclease HI
MKNVSIYTDGACKGNPGAGGYGTILVYNGVEKELTGGFFETTNNRMELTAAIVGLEALKEPCQVTLYSDSKYLIDSITKGWVYNWRNKGWKKSDGSSALNIDLWQKILSLVDTHSVEFVWVKGHAGHKYNERCDTLAVSSAEKAQTLQRDV